MTLINYGNLSGLRDSFRIRTGLTEAGATGDARLNTVLNLANRQLWMDAPSVFQKQELRIVLQPAIGTDVSDGSPTLDVSPVDQRVFRITTAGQFLTTVGGGGATRDLLVGRWIDIVDVVGNVHTRRIMSTANSAGTNQDWGDGVSNHSLIMVDRPWGNATDTDLSFRIYTLDYPLPADVTDISDVIRNPETDGYEVLTGVYPAELDRLRMGHWAEEGLPTAYSDGEFTQLRSPHDTPTVSATFVLDPLLWGYDDDGDENVGQASAGTFSYCYCLVRGRLPSPSRVIQGSNPEVEDDFQRAPFYISAPSKASEQIGTTWGGSGIFVESTDQDWQDHRMSQMGGTAATALGPLSGLEKWWFRACHVTNNDNPSELFKQEADGVYRLIRIQDADEVAWLDKGQYDPVDYSFTLKEFTGHKSIRFDKTPGDSNVEVLVRTNVRPDILLDDNDILPFPPGAATEAVICKAAEYISERDGDMTKAQYYGGLYEKHANKLREKDGWSSTKKTGFGDGVSPGSQRSWTMSPKIREFGS